MHLGSLLLALLATFLLRLLLGTSALIERREVDLSKHIHLRGEFLLALESVYLVVGSGLRSGRSRFIRRFCRSLNRLLGLRFLNLLLGLLDRLGLHPGDRFCHWFGLHLGSWFLLGNRLLHRFLLGLRGWSLHYCLFGSRPLLRCRFVIGRLTDGSSLLLGITVMSSILTCDLLLAQVVEVNLSHGLKLRHLSHQFVGRSGLLLRLLLLTFLGEHLLSLVLDVLVALELGHEGIILLVGDFGVDVGVIPNISQALLIFQEINCRLKSYI